MIVWFSGTGNSRLVATRLAGLLSEPMLRIDSDYADRIGDIGRQQRIIWVCPVYGWRIPPVVEQAISLMPAAVGADATHWLVVTCGDDVGLTPLFWRRKLKGCGFKNIGAAFSVRMPNTYVFFPGFDVDSDSTAAEKLRNASVRVDAIAQSIAVGHSDSDDVTPGAMPALKSRVLCPPFRSWLMRPEGFKVDATRCIGCGSCVRACPMVNITLDTSKHPIWGKECAFCTACYQVCSHQAISHGAFSHGKGRYIAPANL